MLPRLAAAKQRRSIKTVVPPVYLALHVSRCRADEEPPAPPGFDCYIVTAGIATPREFGLSKSPYRPYTPNPEQIALMPAISGNTINGMGESRFRKASPVYWHDPETLHHGELQNWFTPSMRMTKRSGKPERFVPRSWKSSFHQSPANRCNNPPKNGPVL